VTEETGTDVATLAGGCFWCLEAVFREVGGVENVTSGYTGGATINPKYQEVCTGNTGHAEAVQLIFNPGKISYREILQVFFSVHDPTTLNRQGADIGTQYRSVIFYHDDRQRAVAEVVIKELTEAHLWKKSIVTEVVPLDKFYPAEDYHREYFSRHPEQSYCQVVISPKVNKFRKEWTERLKRSSMK
jgi:peptide-methionine (S)-S-oxide reductase